MAVLDRFSLDGRVALVTGGNRGLGLAFARALGEAGAAVALLARHRERTDAAAEQLRSEGLTVQSLTGDVTSRDDLERAADAVEAELGPVDVLVNNAGIGWHRPALDVPDEEWQAVLDTNVTGVWNGCRVFGGRMVAAGRGAVVNIGSMSGDIVNRPQWQPGYNASKAAVHHLTRSLAAEWAPSGVRVNALAPGYVRTDMAPVDEARFRRQWIEDAPQQRAADPAEIAPSVVFLASDASSFMTGAVLTVDGGYTVF